MQYACGYIELGMLDEASDELEAIEGEDRMSVEVMSVRTELYLQAKQWELMESVSKYVAQKAPESPHGWINWANALRFQDRFEDAKKAANKGLKHHPKEAALWFNLACFHSLSGNQEEASKHLSKATSLDKSLQKRAMDDPDLQALWEWIEKKD